MARHRQLIADEIFDMAAVGPGGADLWTPNAPGGVVISLASQLLAIPSQSQPPTGPITYWRRVISLETDLGLSISSDVCEEVLRRLAVADVLFLLAHLCHDIDRRPLTERDQGLMGSIVPEVLLAPLQTVLSKTPEAKVASAQSVLRLALRVLVASPDESADLVEQDVLQRVIGMLLLALPDEDKPTDRSRAQLRLELSQNQLFHHVQGQLTWYAEAFAIFFQILPVLNLLTAICGRPCHPDFIDVDHLFRTHFGVELWEFWAMSVAAGLLCLGTDHPPRFTNEWDGCGFSQSAAEAWHSRFSQGLADAGAGAAEDLAASSLWSYRTLRDRPLLQLENRTWSFPIRSRYLAEKANPTEMFWLVREALNDPADQDKWFRLFGVLLEARCHQLFADHLTADRLIREWDMGPLGEGEQRCDLVAVDPDALLAADFHSRRLCLEAQVGGDPEVFNEEVRKIVVAKLEQINATVGRMLAQRDNCHILRIVPVVVLGTPFPANLLVSEGVQEEIARGGLGVIGRDPRCRPPAVISLFELSDGFRLAESSGKTILDLIDAWKLSDLSDDSFRNWMSGQSGSDPIDKVDTKWRDAVFDDFLPANGSKQ